MYSSAHESPQKKPKITLNGEKEQKKDSATLIELINDNLTDPITLEIMDDPVVLVETAMTYNRVSIINALKEKSVCPLTNVKITNIKVLTNFKVREILNTMGHPLKPLPSEKIEQKVKKPDEQDLMDLPTKITHACLQRLKLSLHITWEQLITGIATYLSEPVAGLKRLQKSVKDITDQRVILALYLLFEEKGQTLSFKNIIANLDLPQVLNNSTANTPLNMPSASSVGNFTPNQLYLITTNTTTSYSSNNNNNYQSATPIGQEPTYTTPVGAPPISIGYNPAPITNYPQTMPIRQIPTYIMPMGTPTGIGYNPAPITNYPQTTPIRQIPSHTLPTEETNGTDNNSTNTSYLQLGNNTISFTQTVICTADNSKIAPAKINAVNLADQGKTRSLYQSPQSFFDQNIRQVENLFEKEEDLPDEFRWEGMTP